MNIDSIKNGLVIDHISSGNGMKLYQLLKLDELDCSIAIIKNVSSSKTGKKDIIKIDNEMEIDTDILGYVDPDVTVNVIKDGKVYKKLKIDLPETLIDVILCKNPRCITSTEHSLKHRFKLTDRENRVYRCVYCEARAE